jgi:hypothetical protein
LCRYARPIAEPVEDVGLSRILRASLALVLLATAATAALAGAEIVLKDGQVLEGVDVRRQDGFYILELEDGGALPIPDELVETVRLTGDKKYTPEGFRINEAEGIGGRPIDEDAPSGFRKTEPEVLAGGLPEGARPPTAAEATEVFGDPARFQQGPDPYWKPETDWDMDPENQNNFNPSQWAEGPVDWNWKPKSAFERGNDVLSGGRSKWQEAPIDPNWYPEDGFKRSKTSYGLSFGPERRRAYGSDTTSARPMTAAAFTTGRARRSIWSAVVDDCAWCDDTSTALVPEPRSDRFGVFNVPPEAIAARLASSRAPEPEVTALSCARELFDPLLSDAGMPAAGGGAPRIETLALDDPPHDRLPIPLHEATLDLGGETRRAIFTVAGGTCRLISGDLAELHGVELTSDHAVTMAAASYDAALGERYRITPLTDRDKIDYAFAVVGLIDPAVSGSARAELVLLETSRDLQQIGSTRDRTCAMPGRTQKRELRAASKALDGPHIADGASGSIVSFHTWSSAQGEVMRQDVYLSDDGKISVKREPLGRHVGEHDCSEPAR